MARIIDRRISLDRGGEIPYIEVSENTYKLVRDYFDFISKGKIRLKGKNAPVNAYQLLSAGEVETRIAEAVVRVFTRLQGRKGLNTRIKNSPSNPRSRTKRYKTRSIVGLVL